MAHRFFKKTLTSCYHNQILYLHFLEQLKSTNLSKDVSDRGWKLNNWITIIHYSLLFFSKLFIIHFKFFHDIHYLLVSSAKHRHYEKTLKSSGKCFIYGKLLRDTNKVSLRFPLRDTLHEAFFIEYQEGNIIDNHS